MAIKAVLFDLDGTLLPLDQDVFIKTYLTKLAETMAPRGYDPDQLIKAVWAGTGAMIQNDGNCTNEQVFWQVFSRVFGADPQKEIPVFQRFYENEFQNVRSVCGYSPKARQAVKLLQEKGITVVLATSPLFPAIATQSRIRWAGLEPEDFLFYTTYENSSYTKPNLKYYESILKTLQLKPEECLMVGNDVGEDMIVSKLGMEVFLLTPCMLNRNGEDYSAYPQGDFDDLLHRLQSL